VDAFALMSIFLMLTGLVRLREERQEASSRPRPGTDVQTNYLVPVPGLHRETERDPVLHTVKAEQCAALMVASHEPLGRFVNAALAEKYAPRPRRPCSTSPG